MSNGLVIEWYKRAVRANRAAHQILSAHEKAPSRVILLEDLLKKLSSLPVDVQDYFREATTCLEYNLKRAAIVLSWAGFFHVLAQKLYSSHLQELKIVRKKWKFRTLEELKENYVEHQILEAAKEIKLISNSKLRVYQGQLATRNQCAHPTLYNPSMNSALGYVDDMIRQTVSFL